LARRRRYALYAPRRPRPADYGPGVRLGRKTRTGAQRRARGRKARAGCREPQFSFWPWFVTVKLDGDHSIR
jgi:hypothetical protein